VLGRQRDLNRRDVRIAGETLAQVGQLLVHHDKRHVHLLDLRAHRPVQHRHQLGRGLQVEPPRLARRKDERGLVDDQRQAEPIGLLGHDVSAHELVEHRERRNGILRQGAEIAELSIGERHHLLEALLLAAPDIGAQPLTEVVMQDQRPAPEDLFREKLGEHAVARALAGTDTKQIVGIAVKDERRGRRREIQIRKLRCPRWKPLGQFVGRTARSLIGRHAFSTVRRSEARIAGGSSS
jgi:hypothetical protein